MMFDRAQVFTILFVFALFALWATLTSSSVSHSGFLSLCSTITSPATNETFAARPAAFGPTLLQDSAPFTAEIAVVTSLACRSPSSPFLNPRENFRDKIAIVQRGECGFYDKVLRLQSWGAAAVIVGDNVESTSLITMFTKEDASKVHIPAFFVSLHSYQALIQLDSISIEPAPQQTTFLDTILFLFISPLLSLAVIYMLLAVHRYLASLRERASIKTVSALPVRVWTDQDEAAELPPQQQQQQQQQQPSSSNNTTTTTTTTTATKPEEDKSRPHKQWVSANQCIICLEDYIPNESKVMTMPCGHEFHPDCITPWLTKRKRTCPICKRDIMANESTPLMDGDVENLSSSSDDSLAFHV